MPKCIHAFTNKPETEKKNVRFYVGFPLSRLLGYSNFLREVECFLLALKPSHLLLDVLSELRFQPSQLSHVRTFETYPFFFLPPFFTLSLNSSKWFVDNYPSYQNLDACIMVLECECDGCLVCCCSMYYTTNL